MESENKMIQMNDGTVNDAAAKYNVSTNQEIRSLIYSIRGQQVMIDSDLAGLYGVETKVLNQAVKRNSDRFPEDFMFRLSKEEAENLRSQNDTSNSRSQIVTLKQGHNIKYLPYAFTENGVAMLSSVLRSKTAIEVNIKIMRAFTSMRSFLMNNSHIFNRIEVLEHNQLQMNNHLSETDKKIDEVLNRLDSGSHHPIQGILYEGQIFDAYAFICDLIESAKNSIILIDNYADFSTLRQLDKRSPGVSALIYTSEKNKTIREDLKRHDAQYPPIDVKYYQNVHDRFMIIDDTVYLVGGSFKDLGKKLVGFSKMESISPAMLISGIKLKKDSKK